MQRAISQTEFEESPIGSQKVINALYNVSYYGKDLLEASGKNNKASLLLKQKIEEQCSIFTWPSWKDCARSQFEDAIVRLIESFTKFVYSENSQVEYFCKTFMERYNFLLDLELNSKSVLPE